MTAFRTDRGATGLDGVRRVLAPLAGLTDRVFRGIAFEFGADMAVTEMVSAVGLLRSSRPLRALLGLGTDEGPLAIQIFGGDPESMGEAARRLSELRPRFVDVNLGCPVRKVVKQGAGAALLKDPERMEAVLRAVVRASRVPVSAKVRIGWDRADPGRFRDLVRRIEDCGVRVLVVHPRTREQGFGGKADWRYIALAKETLSIPVIGNGDVFSAEDYFRMRRETGCDAVMIGRGAVGNPWIFQEIRSREAGLPYAPPTPADRLALMVEHARRSVRLRGEPTGIVAMRRTLAAYVRHLPQARPLRGELMRCTRWEEVRQVVDRYLERMEFGGREAVEGTPPGLPPGRSD
jgi:nifR3 family TIM-barrel protein